MQGSYGLDILKYTETVEAVARTSTPNEVLRGLGYWFFYGQDRLGPWIEAARDYTQRLGRDPRRLRARRARAARGRVRALAAPRRSSSLLLLVGVVIAVGAHPYDDPTPLGALFKAFANGSTAGLALRSTGRAVPLVVLALAVLLGLGVERGRRGAAPRAARPALAVGRAGARRRARRS